VREIQVGASIIYHPEYYIMHMRKKGNDNGEVDKFGLYGGTFDPEKDESLSHTAQRELKEESGLLFPIESFHPEEVVFVKSERDNQPILTEAKIFLLNLPFDMTHEQFRSSKPMTARDLRRAKVLGKLTSVAAEALGKVRGI